MWHHTRLATRVGSQLGWLCLAASWLLRIAGFTDCLCRKIMCQAPWIPGCRRAPCPRWHAPGLKACGKLPLLRHI